MKALESDKNRQEWKGIWHLKKESFLTKFPILRVLHLQKALVVAKFHRDAWELAAGSRELSLGQPLYLQSERRNLRRGETREGSLNSMYRFCLKFCLQLCILEVNSKWSSWKEEHWAEILLLATQGETVWSLSSAKSTAC